MPQFGGKDSKRHFTVVMGGKEHGLYVSSTPSSAAKKAVTKLCAANKGKKVEFHIREITQGSKKKTYGPYSGHIEKLKEPIKLKSHVIEHKPVAKLIGNSGAKKGGMRGENWIDKLDGYSPSEKNFMKEFQESLIKKLNEKMKTRNMLNNIKQQLLKDMKNFPSRYNNITEEIERLSDERINELIKKVEDMLQDDINMYVTLEDIFEKLDDYTPEEKKFMGYFCYQYISKIMSQLRHNISKLNYSMLNGIKNSLKNKYSEIEEQNIDRLINTVKKKHLGILQNWADGLNIPEIEKRFGRAVEKVIKKETQNYNFSKSELLKFLKNNPQYSGIEKTRMNYLISNAKNQVSELRSMYNNSNDNYNSNAN
jgi:hypothetical protein